MKRIYIAGPMTGKPDLNRAEFRRAQVYLEALYGRDFFIVNPHEIAKENAWTEDTDISCIADGLLEWLTDCKSIYMLKGWEDSKGATAEHAVAKWIGLEIIYQGETE